MGRDPLVQLLALITGPFPFPWLNLISHGSCQPLLWHCRLALSLMSEWLLFSGSAGQGALAGEGDEAGGDTALLLHLWWGLWQGTSQPWERVCGP